MKSTAYSEPIFTTLKNAQQKYVQMSNSEIHPNQTAMYAFHDANIPSTQYCSTTVVDLSVQNSTQTERRSVQNREIFYLLS